MCFTKLFTILFTGLFLFSISVFGQGKKTLSHLDYDTWNTLTNVQLSDNGKGFMYQINPYKGDGFLFWSLTSKISLDSISKGKNARFFGDENYIAGKIAPGYDTIRNLQLKKVDKKSWVKDSLFVVDLLNDSLIKFSDVKSFDVVDNKPIFAYLSFNNKPTHTVNVDVKRRFLFFKKEIETEHQDKSNGKSLFIHNIKEGWSEEFSNVINYSFSENGNYLFFYTHLKLEDEDIYELFLYDVNNRKLKHSEEHYNTFEKFAMDNEENKIAFIAKQDTAKYASRLIYMWDFDNLSPKSIIDTNNYIIKEGMNPSKLGAFYFSDNDERLFFSIKQKDEPEEEDSLLASEKAKVDLWHYKDKRLQPQQLKQLKRDKNKTFLTVFNFQDSSLFKIEDESHSARIYDNGDGDFAMLRNTDKYESSYHYAFPWPADYYLYDLNNGEKVLIKDSVVYSYGISPKGNYFVYFDTKEKALFYIDLNSSDRIAQCITCGKKDFSWEEDVNGMPHDPGTFGVLRYSKNEDTLVFYSKYDIWMLNLDNNYAWSVTNGRGEEEKMEYRIVGLKRDSIYINTNGFLVLGVDEKTKNETLFKYEKSNKPGAFTYNYTPLISGDYKITSLLTSQDENVSLYRKMNVRDYPEVYLTVDGFHSSKKITETNPQQKDYRWPTVEKVEWTSPEGKSLEGLVYLPDDFDTTKSYPMLVYFYELYGERKHFHYIPKPTASIIFPTEYTSAEYVVFIPDVRYDAGYPAKGAYDCIMSGTDLVLDMYPNIDKERLGLQGQSWGGYQTAQLITMTDRYKAAMAGAPVSNMFSAYGGIRWGSGLNRQFQYERTQSRIGKTIWEAPELYIENSPLFGIPNITTPLLMMHNDNDGAVPWYQGIEMFMGMKRLGLPVWLLNYNGDEHNLMKPANREDLSIRMRQFFDYYLKGEPAPLWLKEGLPAVEKGENYRLNFVE